MDSAKPGKYNTLLHVLVFNLTSCVQDTHAKREVQVPELESQGTEQENSLSAATLLLQVLLPFLPLRSVFCVKAFVTTELHNFYLHWEL
jgi:hypothetical protein